MAVDQEFLDRLVPLSESEAQPSLNLDRVRLWVEALESGNYQQGKQRLCRIEEDGSQKVCCLEVANLLAAADGVPMEPRVVVCCHPLTFHNPTAIHAPFQERVYMWNGSSDADEVNRSVMNAATARWLGFDSQNPVVARWRQLLDSDHGQIGVTAMNANDSMDWSFEQIAAAVRFSYLGEKAANPS